MVDKESPRLPSHRAYSVIRREGQDDFWLNVGLVFPHKDNNGFNIILQAFPLDGKIVCREIGDDVDEQKPFQDRTRRGNNDKERPARSQRR